MSTPANLNFYGKSLCVEHDGYPDRMIYEVITDLKETLEKYKEKNIPFDAALAATVEKFAPAPSKPYQDLHRGLYSGMSCYNYKIDENGVKVDNKEYNWDMIEKADDYDELKEMKMKQLEKRALNSLLDYTLDTIKSDEISLEDSIDEMRTFLVNQAEEISEWYSEENMYSLEPEEAERIQNTLLSIIDKNHEAMETAKGLRDLLTYLTVGYEGASFHSSVSSDFRTTD